VADQLILVTGSGRSGTSSMSGTLHHLGLHVPGPYLGANTSNPKGFFESKWSVRFHNDLLSRAGVTIADSRPEAVDLIGGVIEPRDRRRLGAFLDRATAEHTQTVVKDPRIVWTHRLWEQEAAERGLSVAYVTMLRHPAEVVGSRLTYYSGTDGSQEKAVERRAYAITNLARWINVSLVNERRTRGARRAFVRYADLLTDWRAVTTRLESELGLEYAVAVAAETPSAVDDFLDSGLRRHGAGWDGVPVPESLSHLAEQVWETLQGHCDGPDEPDDADASAPEAIGARLDELAGRYADLRTDAVAFTRDGRGGAAPIRHREAPPAPVDPPGTDVRRVGDVGGRELLRIAARRAVGRLPRRSAR